MRYLRRFSEFLLSTFLRLDWVPRAVAPDERTSHYIFDKKQFDEAKRSVKYAAFMPSKKTGDISVYRTAHCREWRVWALGEYFVARRRPDNVVLLARGDAVARAFVQQGLSIVAKRKPHPRHAIVTNWPSDKAGQRIKAIAVAQDALLFVNPALQRSTRCDRALR